MYLNVGCPIMGSWESWKKLGRLNQRKIYSINLQGGEDHGTSWGKAPMDFLMEVSSEKINELNGRFSSHAWLPRQFPAIEKIMGRSWEYKHPPVVSSVFALWWDLDQFSFFGLWWHRALKGRNMCGTCLATSTGPTKSIYTLQLCIVD